MPHRAGSAEVPEVQSDRPDILNDLKERGHDYLTQEDLIIAHGRCGALMHGANPFGNPIDYAYYQQSFPIWMTKIVNLLNTHKVHLVGDIGFYLFHMQGEGHKEVCWYRFEVLKR